MAPGMKAGSLKPKEIWPLARQRKSPERGTLLIPAGAEMPGFVVRSI
jgi:hypothetical protein